MQTEWGVIDKIMHDAWAELDRKSHIRPRWRVRWDIMQQPFFGKRESLRVEIARRYRSASENHELVMKAHIKTQEEFRAMYFGNWSHINNEQK